MEEVKELIDQLSKHDIKVVDYDENENSIKNRLFSMVGEEPRGHIFPSSWLDPSGELTIYVPKSKNTPEKLRLFLIEEVKHVDQIRETPFSTGASAIYELIKEKGSQLPSKLLSKLPDFVSEEDAYKYYMTDELEEDPSWKERSGIGQLFRDLRYSRYADPESVEGIHRNRGRYAPVLEKYGVDEVETPTREVARRTAPRVSGEFINYGDYGRSYK